MTDFSGVIDEFARESDVVGLWQLIAHIRDTLPDLSNQEAMDQTLALVRRMIERGFEAGDPPYSAGGYRRWSNQNSEYILARIRIEWKALGRVPDIPDIVWFLPPAMNN